MNDKPKFVNETVDPLAEIVANLPLLMLVGGLMATLLAVASAAGILTIVLSALFGIPEFTLDETTYEGNWVLLRFGPLLLIHGGLAAAVGYAIWTGRKWSRRLVVVFWTSMIAFASAAAILYPSDGRVWFTLALCCLPLLLGSWLYLYHWGRVVTYYDGLTEKGAQDESHQDAAL
jgi:hypothetical protein